MDMKPHEQTAFILKQLRDNDSALIIFCNTKPSCMEKYCGPNRDLSKCPLHTEDIDKSIAQLDAIGRMIGTITE